jgi:hypothetical protein
MAKPLWSSAELAQLPPERRRFWKELLSLERERDRLTQKIAKLEARARRKQRS